MIDISILKMKIFFFISKLHITASFKYLSSSFLVSFKIFSSLHHYSILLTILPNCAGPILPPAPLQQCRRLNFYKENIEPALTSVIKRFNLDQKEAGDLSVKYNESFAQPQHHFISLCWLFRTKYLSQKKTAEYPDIIISSWKMKMAIVGKMNRMLNGAV